MPFQGLAETITLAGRVASVDLNTGSFVMHCRSGDIVEVFAEETTSYEVLTNVDGVSRDRTVPLPDDGQTPLLVRTLRRYLTPDGYVVVRGVHQEAGESERFTARTVYLLKSSPDAPSYVFEETHWWLAQISRMADRWLDELFDARRNYTVDDYSRFYRTNLSITGDPSDVDGDLQECATLSRLTYGLSSTYLLTGDERYFLAAKAAVGYQRQSFRSLSSDGVHCFWAHGRRRSSSGLRRPSADRLLFASEAGDDFGAIPLYEQIYALAGLAQYYRITADWEVLEDIRRTMNSFRDFFLDKSERGYFSHLDHVTMSPDSDSLGQNRSRKNWNSVGDHIPAYLINLVLALEPVPHGVGRAGLEEFRDTVEEILDELVSLILQKFPDEKSDYVNERFHRDWKPDHTYSWQQDRAIVGHNLKISWNLTRYAFFKQSRAHLLRDHGQAHQAEEFEQQAGSALALACQLADKMANVGLDPLRGGVFDAVERNPANGMPVEFAWGSTKDFWQQEQGILAYLALYGATRDQRYLDLARECMAFWNLFFLDRDRQGIFFRTTEGGIPVIEGIYGQKGSHAMAGYHAFELNYLAHFYLRTYVEQSMDRSFCLYFHVLSNPEQETINVLPDFMPPNRVGIKGVRVNGIDRTEELRPTNADDFQIRLEGVPGNPVDGSIDLTVEFAVH